jgi:hypothetical protein
MIKGFQAHGLERETVKTGVQWEPPTWVLLPIKTWKTHHAKFVFVFVFFFFFVKKKNSPICLHNFPYGFTAQKIACIITNLRLGM